MHAQGLSQTALKRLMKEETILNNIEKTERLFIAVPKCIDGEKYYNTWEVFFLLKQDTSLYKDKVIEAEMVFPHNYPISPPSLVFKTKMFHPNIYENGKVCISTLEEDAPGPIGCGNSEDRWTPVQNIRTILISIIVVLDEPNPDSPANVDASKLFRDKREEYEKIVRELIDKEDLKIRNDMRKMNIINKYDS